MSQDWPWRARERANQKINARGGPLLHFPEQGGIQGPPLWRRNSQLSLTSSTHRFMTKEGGRS